MRKRAYVETYGCQMNISDGELMEGILESGGYEIVAAPEDADVVLVNTCAIREHAEQRVLGRVGQLNALKLARPDVVLGVTGCMAQRMGEELLEKAPYVDLVMGPDGYRSLVDRVARLRPHRGGDTADEGSRPREGAPPAALRASRHARPSPGPGEGGPSPRRGPSGRTRLAVLDMDPSESYRGLEQRRTSSVTAWVPIQRGCNHRCTFCIVPYVRGPEKNRRAHDVLEEVRRIAAGGVTEVTLLGQTVNSYREGDWSFPRLLRAVARVSGIRRVRFTSPHPNDVTPELIQVMAEEPAVCEQLHLPVQSGSDRTLKRMVRRYTVAVFLDTVRQVRAAVPDVALSTDVIVAFPGETDREFRDTLDLVREVRFDEAFTYRYSPREGTPATRLPRGDFVPDPEARARLEELIEVTRGVQAEINRAEVGRVEEVLAERPARDPGHLLGRTRRGKVVAFPAGECRAGTYVTVELTGTTGATFVGRALGPAALAESA